jgi:hypothetical protein
MEAGKRRLAGDTARLLPVMRSKTCDVNLVIWRKLWLSKRDACNTAKPLFG